MSALPTDTGRRPERLNTINSIRRIYPYAKSAMPRIYLGMVAALLAGLVALFIPQVLRGLVDGPLQSGVSAADLARGGHCGRTRNHSRRS